MIFSSKLLGSFLYQQSPLFSSTNTTERQRQAVTTVKIYNPGLDRLGTTHFWPFATIVWVWFEQSIKSNDATIWGVFHRPNITHDRCGVAQTSASQLDGREAG